jgi:hypothetical protein
VLDVNRILRLAATQPTSITIKTTVLRTPLQRLNSARMKIGFAFEPGLFTFQAFD